VAQLPATGSVTIRAAMAYAGADNNRPPGRREVLAVCLGGIVGAVLRTAVAGRLPHDPDAWPWATFLVNLGGAFVLGLAVTAIHERRAFLRRLLATGFCGALTTFSTMQLEVLRMLDADALPLAAGYVVVSVALGLACVLAGSSVGRRWRPA
jgi:CrcB protein